MEATIILIIIGALVAVTMIIKGTGGHANKRVSGDHYWEWPECCEEFWRLEWTCSHSNSWERLLAKTNGKLLKEYTIIIIIIIIIIRRRRRRRRRRKEKRKNKRRKQR